MKKIVLALCLFALIFQSCKQENTVGVTENKNIELNEILEHYYQERMELYPIEATFAGETKFNHLFPNTLSDDYIEKTKTFYAKYHKLISKFKTKELCESDKLSASILKWECEINLEGFNFQEELLPINQFQSMPLVMGQLGSGSSAQPFKTVEDYNNWLQRLIGFNDWVISAEARMKEGVDQGYVLPNNLFCLLPNVYCHWDFARHIILNHHICSFYGSITAEATHRNPNITQGNYWRIIYTITNKSYRLIFGFYFL